MKPTAKQLLRDYILKGEVVYMGRARKGLRF